MSWLSCRGGGGDGGDSVSISVRVKPLDIFLQNVKTFSRCMSSSKTETFGHNVEIFSRCFDGNEPGCVWTFVSAKLCFSDEKFGQFATAFWTTEPEVLCLNLTGPSAQQCHNIHPNLNITNVKFQQKCTCILRLVTQPYPSSTKPNQWYIIYPWMLRWTSNEQQLHNLWSDAFFFHLVVFGDCVALVKFHFYIYTDDILIYIYTIKIQQLTGFKRNYTFCLCVHINRLSVTFNH